MPNNLIWPFAKMHGIGNDYVYFNCLEKSFPDPQHYGRALADRHFGIGGDGIVLICGSDIADFRMQMHNSDGSEAEMCGNAVRCVGKYLYDKGITDKTRIDLETRAGIKVLELRVSKGKVVSVCVDMGEPELAAARIPLSIPTSAGISGEGRYIGQDFGIEGFSSQVSCVSMGNPHAVFFVDEIHDTHIHSLGPKIEIHSLFPNRTNVEFVKVINRSELEMRVWERGAGETLACGTGAAAVCVASALNGFSERKVLIHLLGGDLELEWADNNHVFKTGPASWSFEGEVDLGNFPKKS